MSALGIAAGTVIAGRYAVGARIGSGGMGAVYEGVHIVTSRPCAIKLMLGHTAQREAMRTRFFRESRALARIHSEYIVDVLDAGVDPITEIPFLVMERLHGVDLGQLVASQGAQSRPDVVLYLWHAALALDKTHRASIVHRDLKASNLFLTQREDGTPLVKVLDFGVAKLMQLDATSEGGSQAVGTPLYMAPEQFRPTGRVSAATDIYALGMLAYLLLVGRHYWREERESCENPFAFAALAGNGPFEPASTRAARCGVQLPPEFDAWFARATALRPEERFESAIVAIQELASALHEPVPSAPPLPSHVSANLAALSRAREYETENIGAREISERSSGLLPALSFTESQLGDPVPLAEEIPTRRASEHTEMPLSVTSGNRKPKVQRRRYWQALTAVAVVAICSALALQLTAKRDVSTLQRGLASSAISGRAHVLGFADVAPGPPSAAAAQGAQRVFDADAHQVATQPADAVAASERASVAAVRRERPSSAPPRAVKPRKPAERVADPAPRPARESLYRRD